MADNYLEKKFEQYQENKGNVQKKVVNNLSLNSLLLKNRSYRGYDSSYIVSKEELLKIVDVATKVPSAKNQQALRFKLVTSEQADKVLKNIKWGGALPELNLPFPGTEPNAFIIICSTVPENKWIGVDLGIVSQSMLLKSVEMGLNGICIGALNKAEITKEFNLQYEPLLILAIGKGAENIQIIPIGEDENHNYYRKDGVHFVPKVKLEDLVL